MEARAFEATGSNVGDAPMLPELLDQIPPDQEIASAFAIEAQGPVPRSETPRKGCA